MQPGETTFEMRLDNKNWIRITPLTEHTFRIRLNKDGQFAEPPLTRYGILQAGHGNCTYALKRERHSLTIQTEKADLELDTRDGQFNLLTSGSRGRMNKHFKPEIHEQSARLYISLADDEKLYGLGDGMRGKLQKRGYKEEMEVREGPPYLPIPYLMSHLGWGLVLVTTYRHSFDLGCTDQEQIQISISNPKELDFIVFTGTSYGELLDRYTEVSGKPALLPMWGYGLSTSIRSRNLNARELIQEALNFRQAAIPCDSIVLNSGWTKQVDDGTGNLEWDGERFPIQEYNTNNLPTFIHILQNHGFKLGLSMSSRFDITAHVQEAPADSKMDGKWYDHLQSFAAEGITSFNIYPNRKWLRTPGKEWANDMDDQEMALLYTVLHAKQIYDRFASQTNLRPHLRLDGAGYLGIQQYACTHSGGVSENNFENLTIGLSAVLSYGMSGHSNLALGLDLSSKEGIHAGFLQPWVHVPAWSMFWSPHYLQPSLKEMFRTYAILHYRLLPYIYSAAHTAARTGFPIIRAMPLMYPDDPNCDDLSNQYMLGDDLLITAYTTTVYLPEGEWIDYWSGQQISGGRTIEYDVPDHAGGALFIRAGAIIPMWPNMDFIGQTSTERIELHLYPHESRSFMLYEDDGRTLQYKEGKIAVTRIESEYKDHQGIIRIFRRKGSYDGMPLRRSYDLYIYTDSKPTTIRMNDKLYREQKFRSRANQRNTWHYNRQRGVVNLVVHEAPMWEATDLLQIEFFYSLNSLKSAQQNTLPPPQSQLVHNVKEVNVHWLPEAALCIALHTGDAAAIENALQLWWMERHKHSSSDHSWRLDLLNAAVLAMRQVERRGWDVENFFKSDMSTLFNLQDIQSAQEAYERLLKLLIKSGQCKPKLADEVNHPAISELIVVVEHNLAEKLKLNELADRVGVNRDYLSRLFQSEVGESFTNYLMRHRLEKAKALLDFGVQISDAAALTGFSNLKQFSTNFVSYWGMQPNSIR